MLSFCPVFPELRLLLFFKEGFFDKIKDMDNAEKERLIVIDGNALVHRAFHALPPLTTKKGELVNAIYGFLLVFLRALRELKPEFVVAAFDFPAPSFRHKKYKEYKATRKKAPEELYLQIPKTKEIIQSFDVKVFEKEGYEADDIIGTVARSVSRDKKLDNVETIIITGDLDTLQLVGKNTRVYALKKGVKDIVLYNENSVKKRYGGLKPEQLNDFKALRGDPSDNIPGVLGIGEKTAIALIGSFGSIENLYKNLEEKGKKTDKIKPGLKKKLLDHKDKAFLSKTLLELRYDVPIDFDLEKCRWQDYEKNKVEEVFNQYGFRSLIGRLPGAAEIEDNKRTGSEQLKIV